MAVEMSVHEQQLAAELLRTQHVWNNCINNLSTGFYPVRTDPTSPEPFNGPDTDRIFEIFKVMDFEVRHIGSVLAEAGVQRGDFKINHEEVFDEVSRATGITENTYVKESLKAIFSFAGSLER